MFQRLTPRVKKILNLARQEADRLRHDYVGTEHILLGLLKEGSGNGARLLQGSGVDLPSFSRQVEKVLRPGKSTQPLSQLPLTSSAQKVLEVAADEAQHLGYDYVGSEHLVLGLLGEAKGFGAQALGARKLTLPALRANLQEYRKQAPKHLSSGFLSATPDAATETSAPGWVQRGLTLVGLRRRNGAQDSDRMMGLSEQARRICEQARAEAVRLRQDYIATEHLLLGILEENAGVAYLLIRLGASKEKAHQEIAVQVHPMPDALGEGELPFTPRARRVLDFARQEAQRLKHDLIGPEHILLGLLHEKDGLAAQTLLKLGLGLDKLTREVLDFLGAA